jgi:hypothetical protein
MNIKKISTLCIVCAVFIVIGIIIVFAIRNNHDVSLPEKFNSQYISELEQGHHTEDLNPQGVLMAFISEKNYNIKDFILQLDEDMKKIYVYPDENIKIQLTAYDIKTSSGDIIRVWYASQDKEDKE